jgi:hypothetical protein
MEPIIVLSGLPATGKSTLRRELVDGFGMAGGSLNWEDNEPPPGPRHVELWRAYESACGSGDPSPLALAARLLGSEGVVLEWGLPANDKAAPVCFPLARAMRESREFRFVWLEINADRARSRFQVAHPDWLNMFDVQAAGVERHHSAIMSAIEPQVIEVLGGDGGDRSVADIAAEVLGAVDLGQ